MTIKAAICRMHTSITGLHYSSIIHMTIHCITNCMIIVVGLWYKVVRSSTCSIEMQNPYCMTRLPFWWLPQMVSYGQTAFFFFCVWVGKTCSLAMQDYPTNFTMFVHVTYNYAAVIRMLYEIFSKYCVCLHEPTTLLKSKGFIMPMSCAIILSWIFFPF